MAEPGQGSPHPQIIDKPELKSPLRYLFEGSFTLALWALWVYWLLPVVTLFLWYLGFRLFREEFFIKSGLEELIIMLRGGGLFILAITGIMLAWTYYNYLWFLRRGERRNKFETIIFDRDIAQYFNVSEEELKKLKQESRIEITVVNNQIVLPPPPHKTTG